MKIRTLNPQTHTNAAMNGVALLEGNARQGRRPYVCTTIQTSIQNQNCFETHILLEYPATLVQLCSTTMHRSKESQNRVHSKKLWVAGCPCCELHPHGAIAMPPVPPSL